MHIGQFGQNFWSHSPSSVHEISPGIGIFQPPCLGERIVRAVVTSPAYRGTDTAHVRRHLDAGAGVPALHTGHHLMTVAVSRIGHDRVDSYLPVTPHSPLDG